MKHSQGLVYLSRRYRFAASHRLYAPELSEDENQRIFGKCANPYGHGHNYQVVVTVAGEVDAETGMCCDLRALDDVVARHVVNRYDHRYLNLDVEDYVDLVPTGENIARCIWGLLDGRVPGVRLSRVKLVETRDNSFEYAGESE